MTTVDVPVPTLVGRSVLVEPDAGMALRRAVDLEAAAVATYRCLLLGDTTTALPAEALGRLRHAEP